jgi:hypothetical protein
VPLMRILASQFRDEYDALMRDVNATPPPSAIVKRERDPVEKEAPVAAEREAKKKLKVEPPAKQKFLCWGLHPFFDGPRKLLYSRGLLVQLPTLVVNCVEQGLFRAWRVGSPEPVQMYASLEDAVRRASRDEADARSCLLHLRKHVQPALRLHFLGSSVEKKLEDDEASDGEHVQVGASSFSVAEDEALLATLDEACASGECGSSLLVPPGELMGFPKQWIAYKCREQGALHPLLKHRSQDELVERFGELAGVVRAEFLKRERNGRLTDFAFLKRLPRVLRVE